MVLIIGARVRLFNKVCQNNARLEDIDNRIEFLKVSVFLLLYNNDKFDLMVSYFVSHEIQKIKKLIMKGGFYVVKENWLLCIL